MKREDAKKTDEGYIHPGWVALVLCVVCICLTVVIANYYQCESQKIKVAGEATRMLSEDPNLSSVTVSFK